MAANLSSDPLNPLLERLMHGLPLLTESSTHVFEVVGVLESYGEVLDAYSKNLIYQGEQQFLNPFPVFRFFHDGLSLGRLWRHLNHDRINFEYAEYCQKAMLWHGTGGLDAFLDSEHFASICKQVMHIKQRHDPLLGLLSSLFPQFLPELIRSAATTHALGQFWRVMSDLFLELARAHRQKQIDSIAAIVAFVKDGLVAAAGLPIRYGVQLHGTTVAILPEDAGLTFLMDVAVPYVEAVFLRGMPFLGTLSFNAQATQIPHDQALFSYGALFADPLPTMGAGIPPSLLMQDMYRHLPHDLEAWYQDHGRGVVDMHVKICMSFQKAMFCVTNGAINGTMPYGLDDPDSSHQRANRDHCMAWLGRLRQAQLNALDANGPEAISIPNQPPLSHGQPPTP